MLLYCSIFDAWTQSSKDLSFPDPNEFDNREKGPSSATVVGCDRVVYLQAQAQLGKQHSWSFHHAIASIAEQIPSVADRLIRQLFFELFNHGRGSYKK